MNNAMVVHILQIITGLVGIKSDDEITRPLENEE